MRMVCRIVRSAAAAYANKELRNGFYADFVRRHVAQCEECASEVEAYRKVARCLASVRLGEAEPRVQWEDVRLRILERQEARRRRLATITFVRRGFAMTILWGGTAVALWLFAPMIRESLLSTARPEGAEVVAGPSTSPAAPAPEFSTPPPPRTITMPQESPEPLVRPRTISPPVRQERLASTPGVPETPPRIVPFSDRATIAVELSPNETTGAVEAAVVSPDEDSLVIDT